MGKKDYIEHIDYYLENGRVIFTGKYLREKGSCCGGTCRHCCYTERCKGNTELIEKNANET